MPSVAFPAGAELGERPIWDDRTGELVWVDILAGIIHRQTLEGGDRPITLATSVGAVGLRADGGYVAAADTSFLLLDQDGALEEPAITLPSNAGAVAFNDGAVDFAGRFWAGTSSVTGERGAAALYCLEPDGSFRTVLTGITESNGLAWSPDSRTFYYVDSGGQTVDAWDFELTTGALTNQRVFAMVDRAEGTPDGLIVDAKGNLWVALWGGSAVRCYSPVGALITTVHLPVSRVTCASFGGTDLTDLYVTTAWEGATLEERSAEPLAGHVFVVNGAGVGLSTNRFGA
jgi:sugar lactone lactonase YvrE